MVVGLHMTKVRPVIQGQYYCMVHCLLRQPYGSAQERHLLSMWKDQVAGSIFNLYCP